MFRGQLHRKFSQTIKDLFNKSDKKCFDEIEVHFKIDKR
jgi:hypothetical protein